MNISISRIKRDIQIYVFCNIVLFIGIAIMLIYFLLDGGLGIYALVMVFALSVLIIVAILFAKKHFDYTKREKYLKQHGMRIEASVDKSELKIGGDNIKHILYLVAYYTVNEKTYIFKDSICVFNSQFIIDVKKIKKNGEFPQKIEILVNPSDYSQYIVLKYNYLQYLYQMNESLVNSY